MFARHSGASLLQPGTCPPLSSAAAECRPCDLLRDLLLLYVILVGKLLGKGLKCRMTDSKVVNAPFE
jgi:hypothetical protein